MDCGFIRLINFYTKCDRKMKKYLFIYTSEALILLEKGGGALPQVRETNFGEGVFGTLN